MPVLTATGTAESEDRPGVQKEEQSRVFILEYGSAVTRSRPNRLANHTRQNQRLVSDKLTYYADRACNPKDSMGKRSAVIRLFVTDSGEEHAFLVRYPEAREGDILPLFGAICRTGPVVSDQEEFEGGDEPYADTTTLEMSTVPLKQLGCASVANRLAIPLNGGAIRRMKDRHDDIYYIKVEQIGAADPRETCQLGIRSWHIEQPDPNVRRPVVYDIKVTVRVGDGFEVPTRYRIAENGQKEVVLPAEEFKVTDIVLPDPARKIMGWVVLQPKMPGWPAPSRKEDE
jgi:hypothetical protein